MVKFVYNKGCRNCFIGKASSLTAMTVERKTYIEMTEFEVSLYLEKIFREKGVICDHCGSDNIEIVDIGLDDGYKFYDYYRLADQYRRKEIELVQLLVNKNNSKLDFQIGGEGPIHRQFLKTCLQHVKDVVSKREKVFLGKNGGSVFICITGKINSSSRQMETLRIEKFTALGLSKYDMFEAMDSLLRENFS